jgi:hypothetical protein
MSNAVWTQHSATEWGFGNYSLEKIGTGRSAAWIVSLFGKEIANTPNLKIAKAFVRSHVANPSVWWDDAEGKNWEAKIAQTETEPTNEETSDMRHERMPHDVQLREETTVQEQKPNCWICNLHHECYSKSGKSLCDSCCSYPEAYNDMPTNEEPTVQDPRDTNYFPPVCTHCGTDREHIVETYGEPGIDTCCYPDNTAYPGEITELAAEFDMAYPHRNEFMETVYNSWDSIGSYAPMTDSDICRSINCELAFEFAETVKDELTEKITTEIHGEKQQNTQILVRVETLSGKQIPGVHSLELFLQRGFNAIPNPCPEEKGTFSHLLQRQFSSTDNDWLVAYAAQGGGV